MNTICLSDKYLCDNRLGKRSENHVMIRIIEGNDEKYYGL